ncbi:MAG: TetR/AcrR family transcriptional regulator [Bacteroidota bacterium]
MGYKYKREDILDQGIELFRTRGYHHVGINEVLKASGIPKGSFYNFFESKEDFAKQALCRYGEQRQEFLISMLEETNLPPLQRLKSLYRFLIEANREEGFANGCLLNNVAIEVGGDNDMLAAETSTAFQNWLDTIELVVAAGQKDGTISTEYTAREVADYLHSGTYGGFARMKMDRNADYLNLWYRMTFDMIEVK